MSRFAREARTASALNHTNICSIYDIGEQDGRSFIVMEYLEGATLQERLGAGALSLKTVLDIGMQIVGAPEAAHAAGIVHRDIKPANIFIGSRGNVKVPDFGIAKMRDVDAAQADLATATATRHGAVIGTAAYMAPEQARGETVDLRADIWSLGVVLYEMLRGMRLNPGLKVQVDGNPELERIIAKCLEHASRYDLALGRIGFVGRYGALYPVYVRGLAYLAARQPAQAGDEFQRIVQHPHITLVDPMSALARLQLARALVLSGETVKARKAYDDLFLLWKDADVDVVVLKQARAESDTLSRE